MSLVRFTERDRNLLPQIRAAYQDQDDVRLIRLLDDTATIAPDLEVLEWCLRDDRLALYYAIITHGQVDPTDGLDIIIDRELGRLAAKTIPISSRNERATAITYILHKSETPFLVHILDLLLTAGSQLEDEVAEMELASGYHAVLLLHGAYVASWQEERALSGSSWLMLRRTSLWPNLTYRVVLQLQATERIIQDTLRPYLPANLVGYVRQAI